MTIGRADDPGNPSIAPALEAATVFGSGSRNPAGTAAMMPRQQAGPMIAFDPCVGFLAFALESRGPSTLAWGPGRPIGSPRTICVHRRASVVPFALPGQARWLGWRDLAPAPRLPRRR